MASLPEIKTEDTALEQRSRSPPLITGYWSMDSPPEIKTEDTTLEQESSPPPIEAYWEVESPPEIKKEESDLIVYTGITGVSRSGRIRKKSSKLTDYDLNIPSKHTVERLPKSPQKNIKVEPSRAQSLHLLEKQEMRNVLMKDRQVVQRKKARQKDKGKFKLKAMVRSREIRRGIIQANQHMDCESSDQTFETVDPASSLEKLERELREARERLEQVSRPLIKAYRAIVSPLEVKTEESSDCTSSDKKFKILDPGSSLERDLKETQERLEQGSSPTIEAYWTMESPPEIKTEDSLDSTSSDQKFNTLDPGSSRERLERDSKGTQERFERGSSPPIEAYWTMESPPEIETEDSLDLAVYTGITGVSRSGRVRKKSTKLADFESPDEIDARYKRWRERPFRSSEENIEESSVAESLYLPEEQAKKNVQMKDGWTVGKKRQRRDKGKRRYTAYMLWARDIRPSILQAKHYMGFSAVNKRLGELWALVPPSQKYNLKRRAKRLQINGSKISTCKPTTKQVKNVAAVSSLIKKGRVKPKQVIQSVSKTELNQTVAGSTSKVCASTPKGN